MGFSEGAGVALSLLAMHERLLKAGETSPFQFKCGILFCGAAAFDAAALYEGVLRKLDVAQGDHAVTLPTAHIWSRTDDMHPGFGSVSKSICLPSSAEEYVHNFGHTVPGTTSEAGVAESVKAIQRTFERARCT
jgi:hypothetical protein